MPLPIFRLKKIKATSSLSEELIQNRKINNKLLWNYVLKKLIILSYYHYELCELWLRVRVLWGWLDGDLGRFGWSRLETFWMGWKEKRVNWNHQAHFAYRKYLKNWSCSRKVRSKAAPEKFLASPKAKALHISFFNGDQEERNRWTGSKQVNQKLVEDIQNRNPLLSKNTVWRKSLESIGMESGSRVQIKKLGDVNFQGYRYKNTCERSAYKILFIFRLFEKNPVRALDKIPSKTVGDKIHINIEKSIQWVANPLLEGSLIFIHNNSHHN